LGWLPDTKPIGVNHMNLSHMDQLLTKMKDDMHDMGDAAFWRNWRSLRLELARLDRIHQDGEDLEGYIPCGIAQCSGYMLQEPRN